MGTLKGYIKIARPDHWIKNLFILPGTAVAFLLTDSDMRMDHPLAYLFVGFCATCFIASANYVINEWLDAPYDQYHPTKKFRPVVTEGLKTPVILFEYAALAALGLLLSLLINRFFLFCELWLLIMGLLYNIKPFRTKDVMLLDVLSESVNNMIRLLLGWFAVTMVAVPPSSILLGYWMGGAFLMAMKRFAEYRMIGDPSVAGQYRVSFKYYTERTLLASAFFYAMVSTFCIGVFLIKYRVEYLIAIPAIFLLFSYYVVLSFDKDSAAQKPEKLYREKGLMAIVLLVIVLLLLATFVELPFLHIFISDALISL